MSLIDLFKEFHSRAIVDVYPPSARALFDTFIFDFNAAFWPEELSFSDRILQELSGVKSLKTIHDARNILKSYGLIDFRKGKNRKTIYRLTEREYMQTPTTQPTTQPSKHLVNT